MRLVRIKTGTRFFDLKLSLDFRKWASSTITILKFFRPKIPASRIAILYEKIYTQHLELNSSCADVKT